MDPSRAELIKRYAACDITWREPRELGFKDYIEVLAGLGELGLRPPTAPMTGPNVEARKRGLALLERVLREQAGK